MVRLRPGTGSEPGCFTGREDVAFSGDFTAARGRYVSESGRISGDEWITSSCFLSGSGNFAGTGNQPASRCDSPDDHESSGSGSVAGGGNGYASPLMNGSLKTHAPRTAERVPNEWKEVIVC